VEIGFLTAPLRDRPLEKVIAFAAEHGFQALEVMAGPGSPHLDPSGFTKTRAAQIKRALKASGVRISSLAHYANVLPPGEQERKQAVATLEAVMEAAEMLEVDIVCTMAGMPVPGKDRLKTLKEDFPKVFRPLAKRAAKAGLKIAFENWTATNLMNLEMWDLCFEMVPDENVGLNFDPSHLYWQQIDYLEAVDRYAKRIFHTHAKDTEVRQHLLRRLGNQVHGWWRYVIPGYGDINWGVYIVRLRRAGFNGVLSIEHEDFAFGPEEGLLKGQRYLSLFA
jgi:sugar phosphate isomerase/epimerase